MWATLCRGRSVSVDLIGRSSVSGLVCATDARHSVCLSDATSSVPGAAPLPRDLLLRIGDAVSLESRFLVSSKKTSVPLSALPARYVR